MKNILLYVCVMFVSIATVGQQIGVSHLKSMKEHEMFDLDKGPDALCDTAINFDGANFQSIGFPNGNATWNAGIFVDSVEMKFYTSTVEVEAVQFYISDNGGFDSIVLKVYENASISNYTYSATLSTGALIYSKNISSDVSLDNFGIHMLDSSLFLDKSTGYFVELVIHQTTGGFPMGAAEGPQKEAKGGWISSGGAYSQIANSGLDYNWNIRLCTQGDIFIPPLDAAISDVSFFPTGYELTPLNQINPIGYDFWVDVENKGSSTLTNLKVNIDVNNGSMLDSSVINSISSSATVTSQLTEKYVPTTQGFHDVIAEVALTQEITSYDSMYMIDTFMVAQLDTVWSDTILSDSFTVSGNIYDADVYSANDTLTLSDTVVMISWDTLVGPDTVAILMYEVYDSIPMYDTLSLTIDTIVQGDFNLTDNSKEGSFFISDTLYSRTLESNFYSGSVGYLGNVYEIFSETYLKSIRAQCLNPSGGLLVEGDTMWARVYEFNSGSVIGPLYISDPLVVSDTVETSEYYDFNFTFSTTNAILLEGMYMMAVNTYGTILLNTDINYYKPQTTYVGDENGENWQENPDRYYNVDLVLSEEQLYDNVKDYLAMSVTMSPNPANNFVQIEGVTKASSIDIVDVTGKVILTKISNGNSMERVSLEGISNGFYTVKIQSENQSESLKLIINK